MLKAISQPSLNSYRAPITYTGYAEEDIAEFVIYFALLPRGALRAKRCYWRKIQVTGLASTLMVAERGLNNVFFGFFSLDRYDLIQLLKNSSILPASSRSSAIAEKMLKGVFGNCFLEAKEQENSFLLFNHSKDFPQLIYITNFLLIKDNQQLEKCVLLRSIIVSS